MPSFRPASVLAILTLGTFIATAAAVEPVKTKALSTQVNVLNFDVYDRAHGAIGGKIWLSESRAFYGGLDAGLYREESGRIIASESTEWHVGLNLGLEHHLDIGGGWSPYLFGGVFVTGEKFDTFYSGSLDYKGWALGTGLEGGAGVEYWVMPRLSVGLRQLLRGTYRWGAYEETSDETESTHSFAIGLGNTGLILSLYF